MKTKRLLFMLQSIIGIILITLGQFVLSSDSVKMLSGLCIGHRSTYKDLYLIFFGNGRSFKNKENRS